MKKYIQDREIKLEDRIFPITYAGAKSVMWRLSDESTYAELGKQVLDAEMEFNRKAGLTKEDDRLPEFFCKEKLSPNGRVFAISDEDLDNTLSQ
jgi:aldehyde:ferredoxin oxidoreductase